MKNRLIRWAVLTAIAFHPAFGQPGLLRKAGLLLESNDLPPELWRAFQRMGGRMTTADQAATTLAGTLTDSNGSRPARLTVQTPGQMRFEETGGKARVLTFDGNQFRSNGNSAGDDDDRVRDSLMSAMPDSVYLQIAGGGGLRRVGSHFRMGTAVNPSTARYTLYALAPVARSGLAKGHGLQQKVFIAIDETTALVAEIRVMEQAQGKPASLTQTKIGAWFQQSGQWYPGEIVRLENGTQTLKFTATQASTGPALPFAATFQP